MVDPGQLQTALLNLAINASHAMPQGGALSIDVCGPQTDDPWVVLTVTDAGVGMDAATLAQATEPFFTTKGPNGTGLGLSMVQGFVAQSGGKMRIVSAPDRGTKVELCLPSCAGGRLKENPEMVSHVGLGRILLVDDSRDVLLATGALLQKHGYTVTMAAGGRKALALLADGDCFDALVTDYAMPEMTGVDLIAECRVAFPGLPAVIITGFAHLDSIEALGTGALVLQKPFHSSELLQALSLAMKPA
jgi:CheY-like chemotaxis protein